MTDPNHIAARLAAIPSPSWAVDDGWQAPGWPADTTYTRVVHGEPNPISGIRASVCSTDGAIDRTQHKRDNLALAEFIANAPTDIAYLLAQRDAVLALHRPVPYWDLTEEGFAHQYDDDGDELEPLGLLCGSCTPSRVLDDVADCELDLSDGDSVAYPCATVLALGGGQ